MKKYYKKKRDDFPRVVKLIMVIVISLGVLQVPSQSIDSIIHANSETAFSPIVIEGGTDIYFGGQKTIYMGDGKVLSSIASEEKVTGEAPTTEKPSTSIDGARDLVWNKYDKKDGAINSSIISNVNLPSIADMNKWQQYLSGKLSGDSFWLADTKEEKIDDGHKIDGDQGGGGGGGLIGSSQVNRLINLPLRGVAKGDGTLINKDITLNGKHENGAWFDNKTFSLGNYTHSSGLVLNAFTLPGGYYKDKYGKYKLEHGKNIFINSDYVPYSGELYNRGVPLWPGIIEDSWNNMPKPNYSNTKIGPIFSTPECKPKDQVNIRYDFKVPYGSMAQMPLNISATIYDEVNQTFKLVPHGEIVPAGTLIAIFYTDKKYESSNWGFDTTLLGDKSRFMTVNGHIKEPGSGGVPTLGKEDKNVYVFFTKTARDYKSYYIADKTFPTIGRYPYEVIDDNFTFVPTTKPIPGTTLVGELNTVRPKMDLDTSKVKFARAYDDTTIPTKNPVLSSTMPTTNLVKSDAYKLVVESDALGVNTIKAGTTIKANEGAKASVAKDNVITITPGTKSITLPLSVKGGNKVSAVAKGQDNVTTKYGIVGDVNGTSGEVTLNVEDLLLETTIGAEKTITLYNEQINGLVGMSDEIDANGLDITIRIGNQQVIDFTESTKTKLLNTTYSDKELFEVKALVTDAGLENLQDSTTPITFTADSNYLVQVGETIWDKEMLTATAKFKVVEYQKADVTDDKYRITINREGTKNNDPAPPVVSTKVKTIRGEYAISYDLNAPKDEIPKDHDDNILNFPNKHKTYTVDDTVTIKPPSLTGYIFDGWEEKISHKTGIELDLTDQSGTVNEDKSTTIKEGSVGDRAYKAKWTIEKMTVTFDSDGGSNIATQNIEYKGTATFPSVDPEKVGYVFNGWYRVENGVMDTIEFSFTTPIIENIVLKAGWVEEPYRIKYIIDSKAGTNDNSNRKTYYINTPDFVIKVPETKHGYIFEGWTYTGQQEPIVPVKLPTVKQGTFGDLEFTAHFKKLSYNVYFWLNGGTSTEIEKKLYEFESKVEAPKPPTRENYDFMGWYTVAIEDDATNPDETKKWDFDKNTVQNITNLYARWELTSHTVTFDGGNGTIHTEGVKHGKKLSDTYTPNKPYYKFVEWQTRTGDSENNYVYKAYDFDLAVEKPFTLYAKWEKVDYTVTYDKNHVEATGSTEDTKIQVGDKDKFFNANGFKRDGYVFIEWNTEPNGTGNSYKEGDVIPTDAPEDITVYAQWIQEAAYFVKIPSYIKLEDGAKDTPDVGNALATEEISVVTPDEVILDRYPDDDIIVRTDVTFPLTMTSSTSVFDVDVYKTTKTAGIIQIGDKYIDDTSPLVRLNAKDEANKNGFFTLKTPRSDLNTKGIYRGNMKFYISYASRINGIKSK